MNPQSLFCPSIACASRGKTNENSIAPAWGAFVAVPVRSLARRQETLAAGMFLTGSVCNFYAEHKSMRHVSFRTKFSGRGAGVFVERV